MFDDIFQMLTPTGGSGDFLHSHPFENNPDLLSGVYVPVHLFDAAHSASSLEQPTGIEHHQLWHGGPAEGGHHGVHLPPGHTPFAISSPVSHALDTHHVLASGSEAALGQIVPYQSYWDPTDFHGIGHPVEYCLYWQHQTGEDCAVMAQGEIFESLTGHHLTEQQLCQIAQEHGLYDPETGTRPQDVGKLLDLLGVPTAQQQHATLSDLVDALQHNDRVIVGLNANEIWYPQRDSVTGDPVKLPYAGHAVWVTGIEQEADGSVKVILCDSGTEHGAIEAVDVADFLNAWADSGDEMVVAHQPPA